MLLYIRNPSLKKPNENEGLKSTFVHIKKELFAMQEWPEHFILGMDPK